MRRSPAPTLPTEVVLKSRTWVDAVSQTIVVRDVAHTARGDVVVATLSISLQWRSYTVPPAGSSGGCSAAVHCNPILSNVSRVHYSITNSSIDRIATVPASADKPDGLITTAYGNFFIAVCGYRCSPPHNVLLIPAKWQNCSIVEMVSGRAYGKWPRQTRMATLETIVLKALG